MLILALGRFPWSGKWQLTPGFFLEIFMDRGAWQATVHGVTKSYPWLSTQTRISVQLLSRVRLFVAPWTVTRQASVSITNSQSLLTLMSTESVMPSNHLILCCPLLLLPSIFPSIRAFSNELALLIRWPNYWSFSFSISPSNEHPGLISFRMDWLDLLAEFLSNSDIFKFGNVKVIMIALIIHNHLILSLLLISVCF